MILDELAVLLSLDASGFTEGIESAAGSTSKLNLLIGGALAGAAVAGLGKAFDLAGQASQAVSDFQAELGISREEAEALGDTAVRVFGNNWGNSLEDVQDAVSTVQAQLGTLADGAGEVNFDQATASAFALRDTFGVEVADSVSATKTLMEQFGLSSQQASDFLTSGFQRGLDVSGDFLDTIGEYSVQFAQSGQTADQFFSILATGNQQGMLGTDKIADAFKESRIRITELSDDVLDAFTSIGSNAFEAGTGIDQAFASNGQTLDWLKQQAAELGIEVGPTLAGMVESGTLRAGEAFSSLLGGAVAEGTITVAQAQETVLSGLREMEGEVSQNAAGVAIFGTQWEDLGANALLAVDSTAVSLGDLAGATDSLNAKYNNFSAVFEGAWRVIQTQVLLPIGEVLLNLANVAMPTVIAAITAVGNAINFMKTNTDIAVPILIGVGTAILIAVVPAFIAWASAAMTTAAANIAALAPVVIPILAIGAAVGALYYLWESNFGGMRDATNQAWSVLEPIFNSVADWLGAQITAAVQSAADFFTGTLVPAFQDAWQFVQQYVIPILTKLATAVFADVVSMGTTVAGFVTGTLVPAFTAVWTFVDTYVIPLFDALSGVVLAALNLAFTAVAGIITNTFQAAITKAREYIDTYVSPALEKVADVISSVVGPALDTLAGIFNDTVIPALQTAATWFGSKVAPAIDAVGSAIGSAIGWLNDLAAKLASIELPDWMTPGSPTPWETGLVGVNHALKAVSNEGIPMLANALHTLPVPGMANLDLSTGQLSSIGNTSKNVGSVRGNLDNLFTSGEGAAPGGAFGGVQIGKIEAVYKEQPYRTIREDIENMQMLGLRT
jgi:hypothetical protein